MKLQTLRNLLFLICLLIEFQNLILIFSKLNKELNYLKIKVLQCIYQLQEIILNFVNLKYTLKSKK